MYCPPEVIGPPPPVDMLPPPLIDIVMEATFDAGVLVAIIGVEDGGAV